MGGKPNLKIYRFACASIALLVCVFYRYFWGVLTKVDDILLSKLQFSCDYIYEIGTEVVKIKLIWYKHTTGPHKTWGMWPLLVICITFGYLLSSLMRWGHITTIKVLEVFFLLLLLGGGGYNSHGHVCEELSLYKCWKLYSGRYDWFKRHTYEIIKLYFSISLLWSLTQI